MILRPATWEDRHRLLAWRNDPVTIRSLPGARPILPDEHEAWVRQRVTQPHLYIAVEHESPIGTVRLDPRSVISVTIAPEYRGHGWATPVIRDASARVDHPILAQILLGNQASIRAFLAAGFQLEPGQWYTK